MNRSEPTGIRDHGDARVQKIRRLRDKDLLAAAVLFAVVSPLKTEPKRYAAFREICTELGQLDELTAEEAAESRIVESARA